MKIHIAILDELYKYHLWSRYFLRFSRFVKPKTQSSSSRAATSKSSSNNLPLWSYLENQTTQENQNLGDFGGLWMFLQGEKAKWCDSNITSTPIVDIGQSIEGEVKQPPRLPHSSSSEYSSEEEIVVTEQKVLKSVQPQPKKKVEGIVTVSKEKVTSKKKRGKKTAIAKVSKANVAVETHVDNVKKVHFNESTRVNLSSRHNKEKESALVVKNPETYDANESTKIRFRVPIPIKISDDPIHVFIDNSNILVGFLAYYKQQQYVKRTQNPKAASLGPRQKPALEYDALFTILERGRNIARRVLVASSPLYQPLEQAAQTGYEVSVLKRVKRSSLDDLSENDYQQPPQQYEMEKEQCVDELLHLKILESLLDHHAPATLVLASGDGKDAEYFQGGFHKCIIKALERGWKVEVISWQRQLSQNFLNKKFLSKWQGLYHVVFLDWFAKELGCDM
ncbi:9393_t:CDS:2 [Funneliformis geosporum]|uniref:9393_t:CDS:1 n=1 Tax=Funneliformis geosporum TaxID=1117311 RepID=A0A9W4SV80_9GLOM|nr:9393_t:CDS:2 [Funneliformis geosporum]